MTSRGLRTVLGAMAAPLAAYTAAAVVLSWPLAVSLTSRLGAPEGAGDPYLNLWILGWDLRVLTTHPGWVLSGRVFDANIFHPAAATLTYSDHLLPQAIALLPLYLASGDLVLSYNVLLLLSLIASGLAMHALARDIGGSGAGAYAAGLAWAFWPYRISHLIHLQLQGLYFLPLALLFLCRLTARPRWRESLWLGVTAALQALSSLYYGVMTAIALVIAAIGLGAGTGRLRQGRWLVRVAGAATIGAVLVLPVVWPYWRMQQEAGFARNLYEASRHEAVPASYLQVPDLNLLYGRTHLLTARDAAGSLRPWRHEGVEDGLFPGVILVALAIAGLVATRRKATRPLSAVAVTLIAVGVVFSLGPDGVRPVYALAHRLIFGFQAVRAPARFAVLVTLGLAVLAAAGATRVARRFGTRATAVVLAAMLLEYASMPWPLVARPALTTDVGQWLASAPAPGAVLYLPLANDERSTVPMLDSLQHGRPILNGASGQRPEFYPALVDTMSTFPSADALWTLHDFDVRFVVAPRPLPDEVPAEAAARGVLPVSQSPLVERARFPDGVVYELAWSPEIEARLVPPAPPPPPPAGPIPFAVGDTAHYTVGWVGGPVDLPAGDATLTVERGPSDAVPYRFVATARTAPWVARFFEADDRFVTDADRALFPTHHERALHEGRRVLEREMRFAPDDNRVEMGAPGAPPVGFRVPPATREALTALFYLRTLPLDPGTTVTLPVTDGGRVYIVTVQSVRTERVRLDGREVEALRLEPTIRERVPRRAPVVVVAWVTPDSRHALLAADVSAGFGRVRLERRGTP